MPAEQQLNSYLAFRNRKISATGKIIPVGEVALPSGKLLCADPFFLQAELISRRLLPPGSGKVYLQTLLYGRRRVAYSWIQLSDVPPVHWEEAMRFSVDSGLACFVDAGLAADFARVVDTFPGNYYDERMAEGFRNNATSDHKDGDWLLHDFGAGTMAICASGMGDGTYTAWWGSAEDAAISALLIDFELPA